MTYKSPLFFLMLILGLSSCASHTPSQIALNPLVPEVTQQVQQYTPLTIDTLDTRSANYIVRFNNKDGAAKLVSPSEPPRKQLDEVFQKGFTKAGYFIEQGTNNRLTFHLQELLTDVDESMFSFEAKHNVIIAVKAHNGTDELVKTFRAKGRLTGPLNADFATLELDLNNLLLQITSDIINDDELNQIFNSVQ